MTKILDARTGELLLSESCVLRAKMTEAELTSALAGHAFTREDYGQTWKWVRIRDLQVGEGFFIFGFGFENDRLTSISFVVAKEPFGNPSWDDYDDAKERANEAIYDAWLTTQVGSARSFEWGTVGASFDPRGGGSAITLRYF